MFKLKAYAIFWIQASYDVRFALRLCCHVRVLLLTRLVVYLFIYFTANLKYMASLLNLFSENAVTFLLLVLGLQIPINCDQLIALPYRLAYTQLLEAWSHSRPVYHSLFPSLSSAMSLRRRRLFFVFPCAIWQHSAQERIHGVTEHHRVGGILHNVTILSKSFICQFLQTFKLRSTYSRFHISWKNWHFALAT